jgi:predicted RNA-binding Zn-ribbon protein involved in translation (DUF1610 family)
MTPAVDRAAASTRALPPMTRRLALGRERSVVFVASCPSCGVDALWRQEANDSRPSTVTTVRCPRCGPDDAEGVAA